MALNQDVAFKITAEVQGQQAVEKLAQSIKSLGNQGEASAKQMAFAMRMVPAQLTDIAVGLATGQNAMTVFLQQGGQLKDMFGGIGAAAVGVGRVLASLITPLNTVLAVLGATAYAAYKGQQDFVDLSNKLTLTGNAAGYSAGQIEKMARVLSDTTGMAAGKARDLAASLAATGQFVGSNMELAERTAARVMKLTDQTAEEVAKDFANMSKGVAAWAAEHNRSYNYLTAAEFQHIKNLEDMGNKEAAMQANMEALNKAFKDRNQQLGYIEQAWKGITEWASKGWQAMLNMGKPETNEDKLDKLRQQLEGIDALAKRPLTGGLAGPEKSAYEARRQTIIEQMRALQQAIDKADNERMEKAKAAAKEREKIEEIQSGKLAAVQNASIQKRIEQAKGETEQEIAALEQRGQRLDTQYRAGLMSEAQYNATKLQIAKDILAQRMALADKEAQIESSRPVNSKADVVQRDTRVLALRNEIQKLGNELIKEDEKARGDLAAAMRKANDELTKFSTTQQTRIAQLVAEADATGMSTLEYKKHTEALRIDKEAADLMVGKSPEQQEAIRKQADAFKEATNAALDYADAKSRSFNSGVQAAMKDFVENTANAATQAKNLFGNAFKGMEDALVDFVKTGKLDFSKLADSIISDLIRMTIQMQIMKPLMAMFGNSGFGTGNAFGNQDYGQFFANGGIMTPGGALPLHTYASGGVANRPQMAIFGEGRTPEAFVPLPDGRHIPVAMQGAGGGNVTVNVVNNASGTKATAQERQDSNGQRIIDVMIEQVKASIAADISRGTGTVTSALERTYGANRAAGAY